MEQWQNLPPVASGEPLPHPDMAYMPYSPPTNATYPDAEIISTEDPNINTKAVQVYLEEVWNRGNTADFVSGQEIDKTGQPVAPIPFPTFYQVT